MALPRRPELGRSSRYALEGEDFCHRPSLLAHLTFVGDFAAKQRLAKRKNGAIACPYDFAPHDFA
jgi:hypothetical protein